MPALRLNHLHVTCEGGPPEDSCPPIGAPCTGNPRDCGAPANVFHPGRLGRGPGFPPQAGEDGCHSAAHTVVLNLRPLICDMEDGRLEDRLSRVISHPISPSRCLICGANVQRILRHRRGSAGTRRLRRRIPLLCAGCPEGSCRMTVLRRERPPSIRANPPGRGPRVASGRRGRFTRARIAALPPGASGCHIGPPGPRATPPGPQTPPPGSGQPRGSRPTRGRRRRRRPGPASRARPDAGTAGGAGAAPARRARECSAAAPDSGGPGRPRAAAGAGRASTPRPGCAGRGGCRPW